MAAVASGSSLYGHAEEAAPAVETEAIADEAAPTAKEALVSIWSMFMKSEDAELVAAELILVATAQAAEEAAAVTEEVAPEEAPLVTVEATPVAAPIVEEFDIWGSASGSEESAAPAGAASEAATTEAATAEEWAWAWAAVEVVGETKNLSKRKRLEAMHRLQCTQGEEDYSGGDLYGSDSTLPCNSDSDSGSGQCTRAEGAMW